MLAAHLLFPPLLGTLQSDFFPSYGCEERDTLLALMECIPSLRTWVPFRSWTFKPKPCSTWARLSTQGAHLLIMLLHRFCGVTGAELGPLCPTQVTAETAAITQISLSHSNYLTGLASRHLSSCSPRALGVEQHRKVQGYFLHKWELLLGSIWGVHITYPSIEKHNSAPRRAENGFRKQSINLRCYLSDSLLISAGCC